MKALRYGDLYMFIDKHSSECNHKDLSLTRRFINATHRLETFKSVAEKPLIARLESTGGYCDCEVLANSTEHIEPSIYLP